MDNDAVKKSILSVGIPASAMQTTLVREGQQALRDSVIERTENPSTKGYALYPSSAGAVYKTRSVFYALAKECFLSRVGVQVVSLVSLLNAITNDEYSNLYQTVSSAQMLFVTDFFEHGAPVPFSGSEGARLRAFLKAYMERGGVVGVLVDKPLASCKDWYPVSFLELLSSHTDTFAIEKGAA